MTDDIKYIEKEIERVRKETGSEDVLILTNKFALDKMTIESPEFVKHFEDVIIETFLPTEDTVYICPVGNIHNGVYRYSIEWN